MELKYPGEKNNEFFRLTINEKIKLDRMGLRWCNSRNISGFEIYDTNLLFRLHNGSLYLFKDVIGKINVKLGSTIREDIIGKLIRKKVDYFFIGKIKMKSDSSESDEKLLYFYVSEKNYQTTKSNDSYNKFNILKRLNLGLSIEKSMISKTFLLKAKINNTFFITLGKIKILKIFKSFWSRNIEIESELSNQIDFAISFLNLIYESNIQYKLYEI